MSKKVNVENLADAVMEQLNKYKDYVSDSMQEDIKTAAKEAQNRVKELAPVHSGSYPASRGRKPGTYKKSWKVKITKTSANKASATVYASGAQYRLTHLLENGHAKRGGGRVSGTPHIQPAQELAEQVFMQEMEKSIRKGG